MIAPRPERPLLRVFGQEREHYIPVPHQWAGDLRSYLQRNGVFAGHGQPFDGNTLSIALPPRTDAKVVQTLLDRWHEAA